MRYKPWANHHPSCLPPVSLSQFESLNQMKSCEVNGWGVTKNTVLTLDFHEGSEGWQIVINFFGSEKTGWNSQMTGDVKCFWMWASLWLGKHFPYPSHKEPSLYGTMPWDSAIFRDRHIIWWEAWRHWSPKNLRLFFTNMFIHNLQLKKRVGSDSEFCSST